MEFRYHPIIEGLKVNEDGTEILLHTEKLLQFQNDKSRKNPTFKVGFQNKSHSVGRLVCEAWNGLREHSGQRVSKINALENNHYTNLEWKEGASNGVANFTQKIHSKDIDPILKMIKNKIPLTTIAQQYGVHHTTISRLRDKYVEKNK
jgi:hypothetical protein